MTIVAYIGAVFFGLLVGMARLSKSRVLQEVTRSMWRLCAACPCWCCSTTLSLCALALVGVIDWLGDAMLSIGLSGLGTAWTELSVRDLSFSNACNFGPIIGYSAFISEIFRAGIQSIDRGQSEAAMSLGMSRSQTMRHVILPQAVRRVLPPLGNDFIAMLKDSALVSVVGVPDITRLGNTYAASTFRFLETYNVVAFLYLSMTIALAVGLRYAERRMSSNEKK